MAATITDIGNATSITSDQTLSTAAISVQSGDWLVAILAGSNDAGAGTTPFDNPAAQQNGTPVINGVQRADVTYDPGAAGAGATCNFCTIPITDTRNEAVATKFLVDTSQKAIQVYRVRPGAGETISFIAAETTGSTGNTQTHSAPTVSVTSGDIIFGAAAIETDDIVIADSDTDSGSWSLIITRLADGGADASTMSCVSQYKTVTATANQAWACTTASGRDSARTYLVLRSVATTPVTGPGGLHHIGEGMGDTGEGARVPQTLHTIERGVTCRDDWREAA
jgi:hypothetical protein